MGSPFGRGTVPWGVVVLLCSLLSSVLVLPGCRETFRYEWNQRVTVVVQTPDGEVSGSGVIRASYEHSQGSPGAWGQGAGDSWRTLAGEYPVIDLGDGRYLATVMGATITNDTNEPAPTNPGFGALVFATIDPARPDSRVAHVRSLRRAPRNEPRPIVNAPLFVTFDDPSDPLTVRRVDPDAAEDVFGPGYALKAVTIELTDDPPTEGAMREAFPWLVDLWRAGTLLDGQTVHTVYTDNDLANMLGPRSFTMDDLNGTE